MSLLTKVRQFQVLHIDLQRGTISDKGRCVDLAGAKAKTRSKQLNWQTIGGVHIAQTKNPAVIWQIFEVFP